MWTLKPNSVEDCSFQIDLIKFYVSFCSFGIWTGDLFAENTNASTDTIQNKLDKIMENVIEIDIEIKLFADAR